MEDFTSLERQVLDAMGEAQPDGSLRALLATARVTTRDNTGHGFFTYFEVDGTCALPVPERGYIRTDALMEGMGEGAWMGFLLYLERGCPDCLEGFQYGDATGTTVDLRNRGLADLRAVRIEPPVTVLPG